MKDYFNEFKELLAVDKRKIEEDTKKNKKKLLQIQKKYQELLGIDDEILTQQMEQGKNEIVEQLNKLKKKLQLKKNEIDAMHLKDLHETHKAGLESLEKTEEAAGPTETHRMKRSLFNAKPFGTYHSYSLDLKPWTAADILTLKRDTVLGNYLSPPPDDYQIFKNIFDQNRLNTVRKRSISNYIDNSINDIDGYIKDDAKNFDHISKRGKYYKNKHKKFVNLADIPKKDSDNEIGMEVELHEEKKVKKNLTDFNEKEQSEEPEMGHIQKPPSDYESKTFETLIQNITIFLSNLAQQIRSYVNNIAYN